MKLSSRVWSAGRLLLLAGALLVTFLLFFSISMRVAVRAGRVQVPDFTRRAVSDASTTAAALELRLRVDEKTRPSEDIPAGNIVQQDPPAGVDVRPQRTIRVWVSSGPRATDVPSLIGQTERTARLRLDQYGLMGTVSEVRSGDYPADAIAAQDPPPPSRALRVSMLISRAEPPATFVMPDFTGVDGRVAESALRDRGFEATLTPAATPAAVPGAVVAQRPAPGARVGTTDPIAFEVSP